MKQKINPKLNIGDKIMCWYMDGETSVPPGTTGTVTKVQRDPFDDGRMISVKWDNGSNLSMISTIDIWKKVKEEQIDEQTGSAPYDFYSKNPDIFDNFDWRFFRKYLDLVRETGVVNVLHSAPLLYSGKQHIDRYYGEEASNPEAFEELLNIADESRNKMAQGVMSWMDSKGQETELDRVNRNLRKLSTQIVQMWIKFYN